MRFDVEIWNCGQKIRCYLRCRCAKAALLIAKKHEGNIAKVAGLQFYVPEGKEYFSFFDGTSFQRISADKAEKMIEEAQNENHA